MSKYDKYITLDRPKSKFEKMKIENRAAQFAPFAALTGFDLTIDETGRIVDEKIELSLDEQNELNIKLETFITNLSNNSIATIKHFIEDNYKNGGKYLISEIDVKRYDDVYKKLILKNKQIISIHDIMDISFDIDKSINK